MSEITGNGCMSIGNTKRNVEGARRAVEAAEMSLALGISAREAAAAVGAGLTSTTAARIILDHGTEEDAKALRAGSSIDAIVTQLRARSDGPRRPVRAVVKNVNELDRRRLNADIWKHLSQGINGLTGLPSAKETVALVRAHPKRRKIIDDKLLQSLNWLTEFSDAWTK